MMPKFALLILCWSMDQIRETHGSQQIKAKRYQQLGMSA